MLWGVGDLAEAVYEYLDRNRIKVDAVWVDGEITVNLFHGHQVLTREKVQEKYERFNVIMGHSWYELGKRITKEMSQINNVFYVFRVYYDHYEKVLYKDIENVAERYAELCENLDEKSVASIIAYLNTMLTGNMEYVFDIYECAEHYYSNMIYKVTQNETLLDIGAYDGDTIKLFLKETSGKYNKIIAVEPDTESFVKLSDYVAKESLRNIIISKCGAWDKKKILQFEAEREQLSIVNVKEEETGQITTIYANRMDYLFETEQITLIKINYCDGIVEAIRGCEKIIRDVHPKLAMDVGYDIYKVLELSEYITSLNENYKLYVRFNRAMPATLTLYALVEK